MSKAPTKFRDISDAHRASCSACQGWEAAQAAWAAAYDADKTTKFPKAGKNPCAQGRHLHRLACTESSDFHSRTFAANH